MSSNLPHQNNNNITTTTTTAPQQQHQQQQYMNSPSLNYNNLPPDHILNKQRSNISIKQINKIQQQQTTSTNNNMNNMNMNIPSSIMNNIPLNNNPITSILNNNNSIMMLNNGQPLIMTTTSSVNQNQNQNQINNSDSMLPPNNNNNNSNLTTSNNSNNNNLTDNSNNNSNNNNLILTNRTQFLLDSSSISNNSDMLFNIRIGNPKQIDMEITKSGNEIKYYSKSCIHDLDSLSRYWSECYRIESEHNSKPLMYIPITGLINIKTFKIFNNIPIMEFNLEKKYDFRQSTDSLTVPIKFDSNPNIVMVLKLMKMDYVEFIGLQGFDFYLIKNNNETHSTSTAVAISNSL